MRNLLKLLGYAILSVFISKGICFAAASQSYYNYTYDSDVGSTTIKVGYVELWGVMVASTSATGTYTLYNSTFTNVAQVASDTIISLPAGSNGLYTIPVILKKGLTVDNTVDYKVTLIYR